MSNIRISAPITKDSCVVQGAVELDVVASPFGKVRLGGKPTMSCLFARRFTAWVREIAAPLTLAYMGSNLTSIETEGGFVCRERDNRPGEKISEHAKGDAIDVAAFQLENGQNVSVKAAVASAKNDGALIKALRTSACGYFTTVLGPGSDEAHKEHLHFDYGLHWPDRQLPDLRVGRSALSRVVPPSDRPDVAFALCEPLGIEGVVTVRRQRRSAERYRSALTPSRK